MFPQSPNRMCANTATMHATNEPTRWLGHTIASFSLSTVSYASSVTVGNILIGNQPNPWRRRFARMRWWKNNGWERQRSASYGTATHTPTHTCACKALPLQNANPHSFAAAAAWSCDRTWRWGGHVYLRSSPPMAPKPAFTHSSKS